MAGHLTLLQSTNVDHVQAHIPGNHRTTVPAPSYTTLALLIVELTLVHERKAAMAHMLMRSASLLANGNRGGGCLCMPHCDGL